MSHYHKHPKTRDLSLCLIKIFSKFPINLFTFKLDSEYNQFYSLDYSI